ncbi:MAG: hypothetical protein ACI9DK_003352 [Vicingaceae bacterium]|jgi:hypothetical protein
MSEEIAVIKRQIPLISEIYAGDSLETLFKHDQFNLLMNQQPEPKWILSNAYAGNSKYIPIGIKETLIQRIFKEFKVEILREGTMFNAVYVTIRLHYLHPVTGEWSYHDGTGADQIQTKSGASAADLSSIGNNAVAMSLPKAVSFAISDAADHFGKLFGRDLNRKETMGFGVDKNLDKESDYNDLLALFKLKQDFIHANDFDGVKNVIDTKKSTSYPSTKAYLENIVIPE